MFKISKLTFFSISGESYSYEFSNGLNYFVGRNNTGKTEFYKLLDFMFGHEMSLNTIDCYKDTVSKISIEIDYNSYHFIFMRTTDVEENYIFDTEEQVLHEPLRQKEYREKLNKIFTSDEKLLRDLRNFAEEDLTFRSFTMFNFIDEITQGKNQDFLSKCTQIEYSSKLNIILNFIFNKNLEEIKEKEQELKNLLKQLKEMEADKSKYDFVLDKVNSKLKIVAPTISYTGKNIQEVKKAISEIKNNVFKNNMDKNKDIADLETRYNSLFEQIKMYQREKKDMSGIKQYNINREKLLSSLQKIISDQPELAYLAKSIETLLRNLEEGVSFTDYIIKDQTVNKLEKELEQIKTEINKADSFFKMYSLPDKQKAIAVIEEYLDTDVKNVDDDAIDSLKKKISFLKREIKTLKNADDVSAINDFSKYITKLYLSIKDKSNFVEQDSKEPGFRIKYIKKGNVLQPVKTYVDKESNKEYERNYYTGSMARHIVIQLCGYAAFLNKLLKDGKYPIVPIFVIDHISKAFDDENSKVIGDIIMYLLNDIGSENLQVFMFDSEKPEKLGINNKYSANLVSENKTGLCPFYKGS